MTDARALSSLTALLKCHPLLATTLVYGLAVVFVVDVLQILSFPAWFGTLAVLAAVVMFPVVIGTAWYWTKRSDSEDVSET